MFRLLLAACLLLPLACAAAGPKGPAIGEIPQPLLGKDGQIIAVNVKDDTRDYRAMTRQMKDYTLTLTRDRDGAIAEGYGIEAYPNLWIIDPQGKVASHHRGYGDDSFAQIVTEIRRVLQLEIERQRAAATPAQPNAQG